MAESIYFATQEIAFLVFGIFGHKGFLFSLFPNPLAYWRIAYASALLVFLSLPYSFQV